MLPNLLKARLPKVALGLSSNGASVVELDKRRGVFIIRRAAEIDLPADLIRSSFDEGNIADSDELRARLSELATQAGLIKKRSWSIALPEAATRTSIITLEDAPASRTELQEMLRWKIERSFGAPLDELRVSRVKLHSFAAKGTSENTARPRYLVTAMRAEILAEYESVFDALEWRVGMILPRHIGEEFWLSREWAKSVGMASDTDDALLISSHRQGFTAVIMRDGEPLFVRSVICDETDAVDELYRFLLFYRDRTLARAHETNGATSDATTYLVARSPLTRLLVAGNSFDANIARNIVAETFSVIPHTLNATDARLELPTAEFDFERFAAPAGLAALAWS